MKSKLFSCFTVFASTFVLFGVSLCCSKSLSGDGIRMTTLEASDFFVLILAGNKNI